MIKIYLLDDDPRVTDSLAAIVRKQGLGQICGSAQSPVDALEDLPYVKPDLVIADLLMQEIDGVAFIRRARKLLPEAAFIMLSQAVGKDMIASAYEAGIDFYIQKPVNSIEVTCVIRHVLERHDLQRIMDQMTRILIRAESKPSGSQEGDHKPEEEKLRHILTRIGVLKEIGAEDILTVCRYYLQRGELLRDNTLHEICAQFSTSPKSMEQRIRRAAAAGMTNLAHMGLDDYGNEDFAEYAGTLYSFQQIRQEMDYIQGKTDQHGNVRIKKFLTALIHASRE